MYGSGKLCYIIFIQGYITAKSSSYFGDKPFKDGRGCSLKIDLLSDSLHCSSLIEYSPIFSSILHAILPTVPLYQYSPVFSSILHAILPTVSLYQYSPVFYMLYYQLFLFTSTLQYSLVFYMLYYQLFLFTSIPQYSICYTTNWSSLTSILQYSPVFYMLYYQLHSKGNCEPQFSTYTSPLIPLTPLPSLSLPPLLPPPPPNLAYKGHYIASREGNLTGVPPQIKIHKSLHISKIKIVLVNLCIEGHDDTDAV